MGKVKRGQRTGATPTKKRETEQEEVARAIAKKRAWSESESTNYADIAGILIDKFIVLNKTLGLLGADEGTDMAHDLSGIAESLCQIFPRVTIQQLMESEFGQGLLLGAYLENNEESNREAAARDADAEDAET